MLWFMIYEINTRSINLPMTLQYYLVFLELSNNFLYDLISITTASTTPKYEWFTTVVNQNQFSCVSMIYKIHENMKLLIFSD